MSGTRITDQQVCLYMSKRKEHPHEIAAAKAGISVRSARRIEQDARLPSQKPRRYWRSRPDPLAEVWDKDVVPLFPSEPRLQAITILRKLQNDHPGQYTESVRRTLERRISQWRAVSPDRPSSQGALIHRSAGLLAVRRHGVQHAARLACGATDPPNARLSSLLGEA